MTPNLKDWKDQLAAINEQIDYWEEESLNIVVAPSHTTIELWTLDRLKPEIVHRTRKPDLPTAVGAIYNSIMASGQPWAPRCSEIMDAKYD